MIDCDCRAMGTEDGSIVIWSTCQPCLDAPYEPPEGFTITRLEDH